MTEIEIIKKSNTIFSTLTCRNCGNPLEFEADYNVITARCPYSKCHGKKVFTVNVICELLNNNGVNCLVRKDFKGAEKIESDDVDKGFFDK
ncbi:MAG: hypothetical protein SOT68_02045 [Oscillospiraceae bacterium]|nr:hypothetical protein [Oscillospiraceae bacterium]